MKTNTLHIIILTFFALTLTCCNKALDDNAVYADDNNSPIKSVHSSYIFLPVPIESNNSVVTVEEDYEFLSSEVKHYNLVIINSKGEKKLVPFVLDWDVALVYDKDNIDEDILQNMDSYIESGKTLVTISGNTRGMSLKTNSSDEIYIEILGQHTETGEGNKKVCTIFYCGIIKFDKEGNLLLKKLEMTLDFTFSQDMPMLSAPLDDGGYALLYHRQEGESYEDDEYDETAHLPYDGVTLKYFDSKGQFGRQCSVDFFSKYPVYYALVPVGDSFFVVFNSKMVVVSQDGHLVKEIDSDLDFAHCFPYKGELYYVAFHPSKEKYYVMKYDSNGNMTFQYVFQHNNYTAMPLNATTYHGNILLSGYNQSNFVWMIHPNSISTESKHEGLLLTIDNNNEATENILNSDNGLVLYAVIENPDGTCTLYYDKVGITDRWQYQIYIYNIDNIEDIFKVVDSEQTDEENADSNSDENSNTDTDENDY